jgi:hypothetical protein
MGVRHEVMARDVMSVPDKLAGQRVIEQRRQFGGTSLDHV